MDFRFSLLIAFLVNTLLNPLCMASTMAAQQEENPVIHEHTSADCPNCPEHDHHAPSDAGCAGHCLSQAKNVVTLVNGSLFIPTIGNLPAMKIAFSLLDSERLHVLSPVSSPPTRLIVENIVMRL